MKENQLAKAPPHSHQHEAAWSEGTLVQGQAGPHTSCVILGRGLVSHGFWIHLLCNEPQIQCLAAPC